MNVAKTPLMKMAMMIMILMMTMTKIMTKIVMMMKTMEEGMIKRIFPVTKKRMRIVSNIFLMF